MPIFAPGGEKEVTRAIVREWSRMVEEYAESEVIIVGSGPAGLICAHDLARTGIKTLVIERNPHLGGGFWTGGYFMAPLTYRAPAQKILGEFGVQYTEAGPGLFTSPAPLNCAKFVAAAYEAGAAVLNCTTVYDVVLRGKAPGTDADLSDARLGGVVVNWTALDYIPRGLNTLDPLCLEAKIIVDDTGHEAGVMHLLEKRGLMRLQKEQPMWIERSEDEIVTHTGEVYPGLVAVGMSVATFHGLTRMGPTFGAMLLSGRRGAEVCREILGK
jgi:thiazole biosynthesis enzyme